MRVLLVLIATTFSLACGDLRELFTLQRGLAAEFHTNAINISLSGSHLTVMFANSPISELSDSEQGAFARNVAEYIRDHYAPYDSLEGISIGFSAITSGGPITFTKSRVPYHFTPQELGPPRPRSQRPVSRLRNLHAKLAARVQRMNRPATHPS